MHFVAVAGDVNAHQKHIVERVHSERGTIRRIAVAVLLTSSAARAGFVI